LIGLQSDAFGFVCALSVASGRRFSSALGRRRSDGDNLTVGVSFKLGYPCARRTADGSQDHILVREVNYHPDGGQIFFPPPEGRPFVILLARADIGDDVRPEHFKAFYSDGSVGFHIAPGTWHFVPYISPPSISGEKAEMTFNNKQEFCFCVLGS